jgi:hypothetical protein
MMNSFIIKNADQSFDHYYQSMKKRKGGHMTHTGGATVMNGGGHAASSFTQHAAANHSPGAASSGEPKHASGVYGKIRGKRPAARDGHTGIMYNGRHLLIFGGDRHHMPFNDTFMLDLKAEISSKSFLL